MLAWEHELNLPHFLSYLFDSVFFGFPKKVGNSISFQLEVEIQYTIQKNSNILYVRPFPTNNYEDRCWLSADHVQKPTSSVICPKAIHQFQYIKIQPNTIDLSTRLWGINPTNSVVIPQSLVLKSTVLAWSLIYRNWSIFPAVDTGYTFFRACHAAEVILSHLHTNAF